MGKEELQKFLHFAFCKRNQTSVKCKVVKIFAFCKHFASYQTRPRHRYSNHVISSITTLGNDRKIGICFRVLTSPINFTFGDCVDLPKKLLKKLIVTWVIDSSTVCKQQSTSIDMDPSTLHGKIHCIQIVHVHETTITSMRVFWYTTECSFKLKVTMTNS